MARPYHQFIGLSTKALTWAAIGYATFVTPVSASPTTQPTAPAVSSKAASSVPAEPTLDPIIAGAVRDAAAKHTFQRSDMRGGAFTKRPFEDFRVDGVLTGFRIGLGYFFNTEVVKYIQPIYLTPRGQEFGQAFGNRDAVEHSVETKAPRGYAVGAVDIRGGGGLDAVSIIYMRFNGTRIDPTDRLETPWIGNGKNGGGLLDGDGTPVVGIHGRQDDKGDFLGLGLIFDKPTAMVDRR